MMKPWTTWGMMKLVATLAVVFAAIAFVNDAMLANREAARRSQCVGNLKQIGFAILNYERQNGCFPSGTVTNPDLPLERRLGWNFLLISCFEGHPRPSLVELTLPVDDPAFLPIRSDPPGYVLCPTLQHKNSANYVGIAGLGLDSPSLPKTDRRAGFFGDDRVVTSADLLDGRANTMMVADSSRPAGPWFAGGRNAVRGLDPAHQPYIGNGRQFGGVHANGANVVMADCSVRFVKDTVDPKVLEALSTIAGGETVSDSW